MATLDKPLSKASVLQAVSGGVSTGFRAVTQNLPTTGSTAIDKGSDIARSVSKNGDRAAPYVAAAIVGAEFISPLVSTVAPYVAPGTLGGALLDKGKGAFNRPDKPAPLPTANPASAHSSSMPLVIAGLIAAVELL